MDDLIDEYFLVGTHSQGGKIPIKHIVDRPLRVVAFSIDKVAGSRLAHLTTRAHMLYAVECMEPTIFNWSEGSLVSLKDQLTKCRRGELKQFGYEAIVVYIFLERVSLMRPQVPLRRLDAEDPRMTKWVEAMAFVAEA